jgi:hypothetical protein
MDFIKPTTSTQPKLWALDEISQLRLDLHNIQKELQTANKQLEHHTSQIAKLEEKYNNLEDFIKTAVIRITDRWNLVKEAMNSWGLNALSSYHAVENLKATAKDATLLDM